MSHGVLLDGLRPYDEPSRAQQSVRPQQILAKFQNASKNWGGERLFRLQERSDRPQGWPSSCNRREQPVKPAAAGGEPASMRTAELRAIPTERRSQNRSPRPPCQHSLTSPNKTFFATPLAKPRNIRYTNLRCRDVAQFGSAPRSGRGGRRFESCHPDHCIISRYFRISAFLLFFIYILLSKICP
mgnify:CR=1 FL=1